MQPLTDTNPFQTAALNQDKLAFAANEIQSAQGFSGLAPHLSVTKASTPLGFITQGQTAVL